MSLTENPLGIQSSNFVLSQGQCCEKFADFVFTDDAVAIPHENSCVHVKFNHQLKNTVKIFSAGNDLKFQCSMLLLFKTVESLCSNIVFQSKRSFN